MHGVTRNALGYCKDWIPYAQQSNFLLICPEFDAQSFPTNAYQYGNMVDAANNPLPESEWTFSTIERLFDYVRRMFGVSARSYYIYGHSAGGQFVHRLVLFMPSARYQRAIAANPGWYTLPTYSGPAFPYSLRRSQLSEDALKSSFSRDFVLLLGKEDINADDPQLRKTAKLEGQGATRLDRGQSFFQAARAEASALGARFYWQLQTVPGAEHSDAQMAQTAAPLLFAR